MWLLFPTLVFIIRFEQPVFMVMETAEQHLLLGVRVHPDSDEIAEEAVLLISTTDGSAVGKWILFAFI